VSHLLITEVGLEYEVLLIFCFLPFGFFASYLLNPTPYCLSYIISTRYKCTTYVSRKGQGSDSIIMNIGKKSKLSTQSMRPHFEVGRGEDGIEEYIIIGDMMERTFTIRNNKDEVVAQVAKTTKAMLQTAVFGSGSESTIDIAPGVDCSTILAICYGLGQVGSHFLNDAVGNFLLDPLKDSLVGGVIDTAGLGGLASSYTKISNQGQKIAKLGKFFNDTFK